MTDKKPTPHDTKNPKTPLYEEKEREIGGFENRPEPTRFGDWDVNGRCSDF
ncbi:MAG: DUF1674 domain-containing protein [Alphaproteobacteria bacterium]